MGQVSCSGGGGGGGGGGFGLRDFEWPSIKAPGFQRTYELVFVPRLPQNLESPPPRVSTALLK